MRFLHTSDWHLGRIFHGVHLTDDQAYLLEQFRACIQDTQPDAIVIAGDVYDRAVPPTEAIELLDNTLSQIIVDYHIPILLIAGNHDSPERLSFGNRLLARQGLHVNGTLTGCPQPIILEDEYGPVYFVPLTYAEPALVRERFGEPDTHDHEQALQTMIQQALCKIPQNSRKVAIAHAFIAGGLTTDSERPLSVGGSGMVSAKIFEPFQYTALGHLHNSQKAGAEHIRYPGSLMKYSFAEANQHKGINFVEVNSKGEARIEVLSLRPRRDVRILEGNFQEILQNSSKLGNSEDYLQIILKDTEPILDAMGQLRSVFPNTLAIERPHFAITSNLNGPSSDHRKLSEKQLFSSFFEQMTGQALSEEQDTEFSGILEEVFRELREVSA
jgi:DNA repair protein SbcD/Mre11